MAEYISKDQVIDWFRCYGHMDKPIPYDVLVTDIQAMDSSDAANLQQNDNCAAIAQQWKGCRSTGRIGCLRSGSCRPQGTGGTAVDSGGGEAAKVDSVQSRNGILRSGECTDF